MDIGDTVTYVGTGFIGFDPTIRDMEILEFDGRFDIWVEYKGKRMLVRDSEVKEKKLIEMNKRYMTKGGLPARIYAIDGFGPYSVHGAVLMWCGWVQMAWHDDGFYESDAGNDSSLVEVGSDE